MDTTKADSHRPPHYPLDLLSGSKPETLLKFCLSFHEASSAATAMAARAHPSPEPASKLARGTNRLYQMQKAFRTSAGVAGLQVETCFNANRSWSFPRMKCGAFALTLGRLTRRHSGAPRKLGSRPDYARIMCARNGALNPQGSLLDRVPDETTTFIPEGAFGALLVTEHCGPSADVPSFVGIWVPSNDLREGYHCYSLDYVISYLRKKVADGRKAVRRPIVRKMPQAKKRPPKQAD